SIILGDAGVGKTQLINEFWKRLGKGAIFLNGRFFDYLGTTPYKPLLDTLTPQMQKLLTVDGQFDKVFGELSARAKQDLETNWQLWQSQKPNSGSLQGGPESEKYRTFEYLTQLYIKLAHHNPLILWMDDVQWADGLSLNFLAYLLRRTLGEPIQFIFTARKQDVTQKMHPFQQWLASVTASRNIEQIQLSGLSQVEIEQYLRSVFNEYEVAEEPDQKPPVGIVERLWQETQGNPYYISEILRLLVEEERIIWTGQRWRFERFDKITLPSSIVNIVDSHLRRFKDEELDVFMQAAVLGERFSFETLRLVTGLDEEKLVDIVETGLSGYVLKEEVNDKASGAPVLAAVDEVYSFYQTTVRKVLYSKLNTRRRRRTHQRVAESIEHYNADKVEQLAPLLAYHYFNGEQYHLAFKYTVQSAASAWSALAIEETEKYLSQIDEIIGHIEEIKELEKQFKSEDPSPDLLGNILVRPLAQYRILLGEFLMVRGQLSEAEKSLFIALKLSERIGEPSIAGRAIVATGELYKERNKIDRALKFFQHAYSVYQKTGYLSGECRALNRMAWVNYEKGDYSQAIDLSRRCITLAELGTDKLAKAEALLIISSTNYRTARYTAATEGAESVLLLAQSMNDRVLERQATELLGLVACTLGLYEQSLSWFDQALQIARDTGARRPEASLLIDIGEVYRQEGKFQEAIDYFSQAYEVARAVSAMREQKTALIDLGLVYKGLQYRDQAFGYLRQAWALSKEIIDPVLTVRESTGFAELYLMTNDYADALRLSQQALELSKNIGLRGEVWQLLYIQGKIYRQTNEFEKASAVLEESINVLKAIAAEITDKPTRKTFLSDKSIVVELFNQVKNYKPVINSGTESRQD
ncbi:MAG: tetratricopeptide repeat protein, partial [Blastocatellia bacterium]|nr:tetratricopeptide repeat protein [Blastocatellia bacterium]